MSRRSGKSTEKGRVDKAGAKGVEAAPRFGRNAIAGLVCVFALSLVLNLVGIRACEPCPYAWCNDTIAGLATVYQRERLFSSWMFKYPRIHFLINSAVYEPLLRYWQKHPLTGTDAQGQAVSSTLDLGRANTLSLMARVITALMGAGAVAAVFLAARVLFESDLAAFLAGVAMACAHEFVFYAHTGNTDVPAVFWYAWCVYWAAKILKTGLWRYYILLAVFAVLAVGTKDPTIGFIIGLAVLVAAGDVRAARAAGRPWGKALISCVNRKNVTAAVIFVFGFALVNNIITDPQGYMRRMSYWKGYDIAIWSRPPGLMSHIELVRDMFMNLYFALGWPLLALAAGSLIYGFVRTPKKAVFCILPLVTFQLIVVSRIRFTAPRFFMPGFVGLAMMAGYGAALLLQSRRVPKLVRILPVAFVYVTTFCYGLGSSLEMADDSRVRTVEWFVKHVDAKTPVVTLIPKWYGPYLPNGGFVSYVYPWIPPKFEGVPPAQTLPPYVITGFHLVDAAKPFKEALEEGRLPYRKVAVFAQTHFYPRKTIWGFAGWPLRGSRQSSPTITVWEREESGDRE